MMNLYYGTICILVLSTVTSASTDKDGSDKRGGELRSTDSCTETKRLLQDKGFTQAVPDFAISGMYYSDFIVCVQNFLINNENNN